MPTWGHFACRFTARWRLRIPSNVARLQSPSSAIVPVSMQPRLGHISQILPAAVSMRISPAQTGDIALAG